jgi:GntR family transcriptional regulator/MocR family aminotransferase
MDYSGVALDRSSGPSLYLQLAEALASAAAGGDLAVGERLPSEREMAGVLGVSRTTVVAAYRELESRGLARGHVGRGTFVVGGAGADDEGAPFAWRGKLASGTGSFFDPALRALAEEAPPGTVSFGPGAPALDRFPVDAFRRLADRVLRRGPRLRWDSCPPKATPPCARRSPPGAGRILGRCSWSPAPSRGSTS